MSDVGDYCEHLLSSRGVIGQLASLLLVVAFVTSRSFVESALSQKILEKPVACGTFTFNHANNDYETRRTVSCRSVDWCGARGMTPLQKYHGPRLKHSMTDKSNVRIDPTELVKSSQLISENRRIFSSEEERIRLEAKARADARASQPLDAQRDLHILYRDNDIVVVHKPNGILCVPGPRRNPSLANLVHETLKVAIDVDKTVVHRLDMETSGLVVFAQTEEALKALHSDFRQRCVQKTYQALVCGHLEASEIEIDVALERDPHHAPFMRVARPKRDDSKATITTVHKFLGQAPKPSLTEVRALSYEYLDSEQQLPVTRLELRPHTGRTHQLRVHCAAIGHPIVGDSIYGYNGEGAPHGGLLELDDSPQRLELERHIYELRRSLCLHAHELCIRHPRTRAPMSFEVDASF